MECVERRLRLATENRRVSRRRGRRAPMPHARVRSDVERTASSPSSCESLSFRRSHARKKTIRKPIGTFCDVAFRYLCRASRSRDETSSSRPSAGTHRHVQNRKLRDSAIAMTDHRRFCGFPHCALVALDRDYVLFLEACNAQHGNAFGAAIISAPKIASSITTALPNLSVVTYSP
jgi:hypothetical protein